MSNFDPYYQWLGIPPSEQPANHYRLLGLTTYEPDHSVIENAADQRVLLVRNVASGPNVKDAQRLLNEISAAKLALLDQQHKAQYDQSLRQSSQRVGEMPVRPPRPHAGVEGGTDGIAGAETNQPDIHTGNQTNVTSVRTRKKHSKSLSTVAMCAIGGAAILLVAALFFILRGLSDSNENAADKPKPTGSLTIRSISDQAAKVGEKLVIKAKLKIAGDIVGKPKFSFQSGVPMDATIDKRSGEISWTPSLNHGGRIHSFRFQVKADNASDTMRFAVEVARVNQPPRIRSIADRDAKLGQPVTLQLRATDGRKGGPVTYRLVSELSGARIGSTTGSFRWVPTNEHAGKTFNVKVAAIDDEGAESYQTFAIRVANSPKADPVIRLASTIDLKRDVVSGNSWHAAGNGISVRKESAARMTLTTTPPASQYMLASKICADGQSVVAGLLADERQVMAVLGATEDTTGLQAKDGTLVGSVLEKYKNPLTPDRETDVRYIVHHSGVLVTCDGEPVIDWRGDWSNLAEPGPKWRIPATDKLFVGADQSDSRWDDLRLEPIDNAKLAKDLERFNTQLRGKMPDAGEIENARALALKAFGSQIDSSQSLDALRKLYEKIKSAAVGDKISAAERYVLTEMAIDVAARSGKAKIALALVDKMGKDYGIDSANRYRAVIQTMVDSRHNSKEPSQAAIAAVAAELLPSLIRDEQFRVAYDVANQALKAARKGRVSEITKHVVEEKKDILTLGKMHPHVVLARKQLTVDPAHEKSNTIIGRWEAFVSGRWPVGLQHLAKGDQAMLKEIATRDLTEPADPDAQFKLAMDWYSLALKIDGRRRREIMGRAAYWYEIATPKMSLLKREAIPAEFKQAIEAFRKGTGHDAS